MSIALAMLEVLMSGGLLISPANSYEYGEKHSAGRLENASAPNGVTAIYAYDDLNRVTGISIKDGSATRATFGYVLGDSGKREHADEYINASGAGTRDVDFSYDPLYRLTQESITRFTPTGSITYDSASGYTDTTGYDRVGNRGRRSSTVSGVSAVSSYGYNDNDWLNTEGYDANGNTVDPSTDTATYGYNFENKLVSRTGGGLPAVTLIYDGDGNLMKKTVGGTTTCYLVDDLNPTGYAQVIEERPTLGGNPVVSYVYGLDLISQKAGSTTRYYHYDAQGSTRLLTNASGSGTDAFVFDAFGIDIDSAISTTPVHYRYTGEQWDSDLGMYYLRARYYDPQIGRFMSRDPFEGIPDNPLTLHPYLYAHNNPVMNVDPSGNFTISESVATIKTVSFLSARVAVSATRVYFTATSVMDAIDTVQGITQAIRNGDLIRSVKHLIGGIQQQNAWKFTIRDVEHSFKENIDDVIARGLGGWAKGFQKAILRGDRVDSILIYAPTPVAGIPFSTVPSGIRWRGIQVELAFGDPGQRDTRIMGIGLKMKKQRYPQNLHQLWPMDAGSAHRQKKPHEIAIIDDPPHFHYHVNQW